MLDLRYDPLTTQHISQGLAPSSSYNNGFEDQSCCCGMDTLCVDLNDCSHDRQPSDTGWRRLTALESWGKYWVKDTLLPVDSPLNLECDQTQTDESTAPDPCSVQKNDTPELAVKLSSHYRTDSPF